MLTKAVRVDVQTTNFMETVTDREGRRGYVFGKVLGKPHTDISTLAETHANVFHCTEHNLFYALNTDCAECVNAVAQLA